MSNVVRTSTLTSACEASSLRVASEPVELGHSDVHQHDIRFQVACLFDSGGAIRGLSDDMDVGLCLEDQAEAVHQGLSASRTLIIDPPVQRGKTARTLNRSGACSRLSLDRAAVERDALPHTDQAVATAVEDGCAIAVVPNIDCYCGGPEANDDLGARRGHRA